MIKDRLLLNGKKSLSIGSVVREVVLCACLHEFEVDVNGTLKRILALPWDEKIRVDCIEPDPIGGSASNTGRGLVKLGFEVYIVACIGDDSAGDYVRAQLHEANVNTEFLFVAPNAPTAKTTALINKVTGAVTLLVDGRKTASSTLGAEQVHRALSSGIDFDLILLGSVGSGFGGIAEEIEQYKTAALSSGRDVLVFWNPGRSQQELLTRREVPAMSFLGVTDRVILNLSEARVVMGIDDSFTPPESVLKSLRVLESPTPLVITTPERVYWLGPDGDAFSIGGYYVKPKSTYGAGDTFTATYGEALTQGFPEELALTIAMANAREVVQKLDAVEGQKDWQWLLDFVENHPHLSDRILSVGK